jgi:hypothetical protein
MQAFQELSQRFDGLEQRDQQRVAATQQRAAENVFLQQMETIRGELKKDGYPDGALTDEAIRAAFIVANGNMAAAQKILSDQRAAFLTSNAPTPPTGGELDLSGGTPRAPAKKPAEDSWSQARTGAQEFLRRGNKTSAQG